MTIPCADARDAVLLLTSNQLAIDVLETSHWSDMRRDTTENNHVFFVREFLGA